MAGGARGLVGWFVQVSWGFHGVPVGSRVFLVTEVNDAREGSWRQCFVVLALLGH
jgi:hypothetical protein